VTTTEAKILLIEAGPQVLGRVRPQAAALHAAATGEDGRRGMAEHHGARHGLRQCHRHGPRRGQARSGPDENLGGGVQASPLAAILAAATGAGTDRAGRVAVLPDCSLPGHPEVFAIGDMVRLNDLPGVAQPAIQEGTYVGRLIRARLAGKAGTAPFAYRDKGSMATIGHLVRRHRLVRDEVHRRHRLHDVGNRPRAVPDRLGQTG